ncbi:MAG: NTP transferase domain-containing protein [Clostridium sp.]
MVKINLILLASGNSIRFNGNKLLSEFKGLPLYMHTVKKVKDIDFNKVICVTQYKEIVENLKGKNIHVVINENSRRGISESIKLGINYDRHADGYMFMVCDQPFIKKETLQKMVDIFERSSKGIVALGSDEDSVIGNPVLFSSRYINELLSLEGDTGGKKIVKKHTDDLEIVNAYNNLELTDIDTKEVYEKLK